MTNPIYVGLKSGGGCRLEVSDFAKVSVASNVIMGDESDKAHTSSNRVVVCNGGELSASKLLVRGNDSEIAISNGLVTASAGIVLGTNSVISVAGQYALLESVSSGMDFGYGSKLRMAIPKEGFTDRSGNPRAAVSIVGDVVLDDALEIDVEVGEFTKRGSAVDEAELLYVSTGISDSLLSKVTIIGENCRIKRSADGKTLKVAKSNGLVLFVR